MPFFKRLYAYLLPRLAERSTLIGVATLGAAIGGFVVAPDRVNAIATAVSTIAGIALVVTKEAP